MEQQTQNNKWVVILGGMAVVALLLGLLGVGAVAWINNRNANQQREIEMNNKYETADEDTSYQPLPTNTPVAEDIDQTIDEVNQVLKELDNSADFENFSDAELGL